MQLKEKLLSTNFFCDNEYLDKYIGIVTHKDCDEYIENHHIIPRAYFRLLKIDIDNSEENLVSLSAYNHILAHYYLYRCVKDSELKNRLALTFVLMKNNKQEHLLTLSENKFLEQLPYYAELMEYNYWRGRKRSKENKKKLREIALNRTPELQAKMSIKLKGRKFTPEQRKKMSESAKRRDPSTFARGFHLTEEQKENLRQANLGKKQSPETIEKRKESLHKLKWFNNGEKSIRVESCPDGFIEGRLSYLTDDAKRRCSQVGKHWYNNGIINIMAFECPDGFISGKIKKT